MKEVKRGRWIETQILGVWLVEFEIVCVCVEEVIW